MMLLIRSTSILCCARWRATASAASVTRYCVCILRSDGAICRASRACLALSSWQRAMALYSVQRTLEVCKYELLIHTAWFDTIEHN